MCNGHVHRALPVQNHCVMFVWCSRVVAGSVPLRRGVPHAAAFPGGPRGPLRRPHTRPHAERSRRKTINVFYSGLILFVKEFRDLHFPPLTRWCLGITDLIMKLHEMVLLNLTLTNSCGKYNKDFLTRITVSIL